MRKLGGSKRPRRTAGLPRRALGALAGIALAGLAVAALPSAAAPESGAGEFADGAAVTSAGAFGTGTKTITLVTGDTVHVSDLGDNRYGLRLDSADDSGVAYSSWTDAAGDLHVIPADALRLVPNRLDPRLFNLSALVRDGYDDASRASLPVILEFSDTPFRMPGTTATRALPSIGAVAATVRRTDADLLGSALARSGPGFISGLEKIWLDGPVRASLDESVPQIGAPEVWADGFDGSGVTIAVLDTGIDETHPDLAGRVVEAKNFSTSTVLTDVFGHGTHVASIAAGNGAASDEQFTGVAPGAELVSAKVLDDTGQGTESSVIAGMEWAAIDIGAPIANISVNSGPTDGTDLMSQAINSLSESRGTLFVVSAGDGGYGYDETVAAPATADDALAVGAVDKSDLLADFTGLGPRTGSFALKPEITAPGVAITASRAAGSSIGNPVDDRYTELTGTSMAAPHVAGAAALLLQAHPDLSWDGLKAALVTSAHDGGYSVYEQGGGRLDAAAAVDQKVHAFVPSLNFGVFAFPHDDDESVQLPVPLRNDGDTSITLDLAVDGDERGR